MPAKRSKTDLGCEVAEELDVALALEGADEEVTKKVVKPNDEERRALSLFCEKSLKCKEKQAEIKNSVKQMKVQVADLRKSLLQAMKLSGKDVFVIPRVMLRKAENEALKKKFSMPPAYLRLKTNSKDLSITDEVISEAVDSLSDQDIADQDMLSAKAQWPKPLSTSCAETFENTRNNLSCHLQSLAEFATSTLTMPRKIARKWQSSSFFCSKRLQRKRGWARETFSSSSK